MYLKAPPLSFTAFSEKKKRYKKDCATSTGLQLKIKACVCVCACVCLCVSVCVCLRERERERLRNKDTHWGVKKEGSGNAV